MPELEMLPEWAGKRSESSRQVAPLGSNDPTAPGLTVLEPDASPNLIEDVGHPDLAVTDENDLAIGDVRETGPGAFAQTVEAPEPAKSKAGRWLLFVAVIALLAGAASGYLYLILTG